MSNGTPAGNVFGAQAKENYVSRHAGQIYRDQGPPNDLAAHVGAVYIDTDTWRLYQKRKPNGNIDTWGQWIFDIPADPATIRTRLKWHGAGRPSNSLGENGDYYIMWHCDNASLIPRLFGPKASGRWPENGVGDEWCATSAFAEVTRIGVQDEEGIARVLDQSQALTYIGVLNEASWYATDLACFTPRGVDTFGRDLETTINPIWNSQEDRWVELLVQQAILDGGVTFTPEDEHNLARAIRAIAEAPTFAFGVI